MDTPDEARDYDAMDHSAVNRAFVADFRAAWNGTDPILDLGTGTALIPVEFCRQSPAGRVVAVDLANEMLAVAARNVRAANVGERIELRLVDAKALPFADGALGAVMSNSIVHHIPEPRHVLTEAVRVTRPGGVFFIRDLLRPPDRATLDRLVRQYAGDANAHQQQMFADSLHAALNLDEIRALVVDLGFAPETVQPTSDRHWTWSALKSTDQPRAVAR